MASVTKNECIATDWLEEENLMLLECWARDGYTLQDICNRIGIAMSTLTAWRKQYPEIDKALKNGREIVDYKVENALLKSALGYKTKEVKVVTEEVAEYSFKKALTAREQLVFDHFLSNRNTIVYAKDLAKILELPRDYVYKYIKNLRSKLNEDVLQNADNGGYLLKV